MRKWIIVAGAIVVITVVVGFLLIAQYQFVDRAQ